jgi:hypothetical protein
MRQCLLKNSNGGQQVSWIDSRGAIVGYRVELKEDKTFWEVMEVYPHEVSEEYLKYKQSVDKHQRKGSDI